MKAIQKVVAILAFTSLAVSAQGLNSRVGTDTGGGGGTAGRTILRAEMNLIRSLTTEELRSGVHSGIGNSISIDSVDSPASFTSKFALDLENVEEITLKDGTVLKIREIREKVLDNLTSPE